MKNLLIAAAALTMISSSAFANPDKWDLRGADQVQTNQMEKSGTVYEDLNIDYGNTASISAGQGKTVENLTDLRIYNR